MKKLILSLFLLSVIFLGGCSHRKGTAAGEEDKIYVFADSVQFNRLHDALDDVFGKIIYTPQPEKIFTLLRKDPKELEQYKNYKNLIIITPSKPTDNAVDISSILDSHTVSQAAQGKQLCFTKHDIFASSQIILLLISDNLSELNNAIRENSVGLLYGFQKTSNKRLMHGLYDSRFENKPVESKLLRQYGWIIYVQKEFQLVLDKPEDNFVWLRYLKGHDMAKWIFVHWKNNTSPEFLNPDSIRAERDKLTQKYLKPAGSKNFVKIKEEYNTFGEMNFLGHYALAAQGLWEMNDKSMGGPFISYTFYDEKTKRIYMLDASLYAPRYMKKSLIQQLDIILQSFQTEPQLSAQRKQELLNIQ